MTKRQPETAVVEEVLAWSKCIRGLTLWKVRPGVLQHISGSWLNCGPNGMPDLIGIYNARFIGVECKRKGKGGVQSPPQIKFQKLVESYGGLYILAKSYRDVAEAL